MGIEHGESSVTIDGNIISVTLLGAFNEYGLQEIANALKHTIEGLQGRKFSILVNALEFQGATPEAYVELDKLNAWLNTQNMMAKALLITSDSTLNIIKTRIPSIQSQKMEVFDNKADAIAWLKAQA